MLLASWITWTVIAVPLDSCTQDRLDSFFGVNSVRCLVHCKVFKPHLVALCDAIPSNRTSSRYISGTMFGWSLDVFEIAGGSRIHEL